MTPEVVVVVVVVVVMVVVVVVVVGVGVVVVDFRNNPAAVSARSQTCSVLPKMEHLKHASNWRFFFHLTTFCLLDD